MDILGKLKDSIFESDPPAAPNTANNAPFVPAAPAPIPQPVSVDMGDLASLRAKVAPAAGPLTSFLATADSLKEYISDEVARYKAAAKALKTQGVPLDVLTTEVAAALSRLGKEVDKFNAAKATKVQMTVTNRETSLKSISDQISTAETSMASLRSSRDQIAAEISSAKASIESRESSFKAAVQIVRGEYEDIASKVNAYLGVTK